LYNVTPDLQIYPVMAFSIQVFYNLPGLSGAQLHLSREALPLIFSGNVTMWNDPIISKTNPQLSLPNASIEVIVPIGDHGITHCFTEGLSSFSPEWETEFGTLTEWPTAIIERPNFSTALRSTGVLASLTLKPFSIGYADTPSAKATSDLPHVAMTNRFGDYLSDATHETVEHAISGAFYDERLGGHMVDSPIHDAWPLSSFVYLFYRTNEVASADCDEQRELFKFWRWILEDPVPRFHSESLFYYHLEENITATVMNKLAEVSCNFRVQIGREVIVQHTSSGFLALIILASVSLGLIGVLFIPIFFRKVISLSERIHLALVLAGGSIALVSSFAWYLVPSSNVVCQLRIWLSLWGISLILSSVFGRLMQYYFIWYYHFKQVRKLEQSTIVQVLAASVVAVQMIQTVILIVWTAVDPYSSRIAAFDVLNLQDNFECASNSIWVWGGIELAFAGVALLWGTFWTYCTWQLNAIAGDSKYMVLVLYNIIIVVIVLPFLATSVLGEDSFALLMGFAFLVLTDAIVFPLFIPRAFKLLQHWRKKKVKESLGSNRTETTERSEKASEVSSELALASDEPAEVQEVVRLESARKTNIRVQQEMDRKAKKKKRAKLKSKRPSSQILNHTSQDERGEMEFPQISRFNPSNSLQNKHTIIVL
jgi:ABC-type phosphate transport system substrate-binding protein